MLSSRPLPTLTPTLTLTLTLPLVQVLTSHLLLTDVDLWPSRTAYAAIMRSRLLRRARTALVLPAFEFHDDRSKVRSKPSPQPDPYPYP